MELTFHERTLRFGDQTLGMKTESIAIFNCGRNGKLCTYCFGVFLIGEYVSPIFAWYGCHRVADFQNTIFFSVSPTTSEWKSNWDTRQEKKSLHLCRLSLALVSLFPFPPFYFFFFSLFRYFASLHFLCVRLFFLCACVVYVVRTYVYSCVLFEIWLDFICLDLMRFIPFHLTLFYFVSMCFSFRFGFCVRLGSRWSLSLFFVRFSDWFLDFL